MNIAKIEPGIIRSLIVEGSHEEMFFKMFVKFLGMKQTQVFPIGGKTKLKENLPLHIKDSGFANLETLIIVRDADDDPDAAFRSVADSLKKNELEAPARPWTFRGKHPKVGVMILPDAKSPGSLETLCLRSVEDNSIFECLRTYFECLGNNDVDLSTLNDKQRVQAFLSSKPVDFCHTGLAAKHSYWDFKHIAFHSIADFLTK